jgi:hypothetical protein
MILNDPAGPGWPDHEKENTMTRFAIAAALALTAAVPAAAIAQDVTRAEPAARYVSPSDLALLPADTVTVTTGNLAQIAAADAIDPRDRALKGLAADASVTVSVFDSGNTTVSVR